MQIINTEITEDDIKALLASVYGNKPNDITLAMQPDSLAISATVKTNLAGAGKADRIITKAADK